MRFILALILIMASCHSLWAQGGVITGRLIDFESNEPITDGIVILFGTSTGTMTDDAGYFALKRLPVKRSELIIHDDDSTYRHMIIGNIFLTPTHTTIDIGNIPIIKRDSPIESITGECITVEGYSFKIKKMDGAFRYLPGAITFIDLDLPEKCR